LDVIDFQRFSFFLLFVFWAPSWASQHHMPVVAAVIDGGIFPDQIGINDILLPGADLISKKLNSRGGRSLNFAPDPLNVRCPQFRQTPMDELQMNHGTDVAGLIFSSIGRGVHDVENYAKILPVRVFGACGSKRKDLIDSIVWAIGLPVQDLPINPYPARILNISLTGGGTTCGQDMQEAVDAALNMGSFVVVAAGNSFGSRLLEPANCRGVISVGAVNSAHEIANYSSVDERIVVYAFGGDHEFIPRQYASPTSSFRSTKEDFSRRPTYRSRGVGTSFAAPLVSGFIANLLSENPTMTPAEFLMRIHEFSVPLKAPQTCPKCKPLRLDPNSLPRKTGL